MIITHSDTFSISPDVGFRSLVDIFDCSRLCHLLTIPQLTLLEKRRMRLTTAKQNTLAFAEYLDDIGSFVDSSKIGNCANSLSFHKDHPTDEFFKMFTPQPCGVWRVCQICAIRRQGRYLGKYFPHVTSLAEQGYAFSFCTFTVKNDADLRTAFDSIKNGMKAMLNHRRRASLSNSKYLRIEFSKVRGGLITTEVKRGSGSRLWHPHHHVLVVHDKNVVINSDLLSGEWSHFNKGAGHKVHVEPVTLTVASLIECIKYPIKFGDLSPADIYEAWTTLKGEFMIKPFGLMRGADVALPAEDAHTFTDNNEVVLNYDEDTTEDELLSLDSLPIDNYLTMSFLLNNSVYRLCEVATSTP